jgi:hypothetical protein
MSFVPSKYEAKGAIVVPLILQLLDYPAEKDRAIALLNYTLLDEEPDTQVVPPMWARRYLFKMIELNLKPSFFPKSKQGFFNLDFYKDKRSLTGRESIGGPSTSRINRSNASSLARTTTTSTPLSTKITVQDKFTL